MSRNEHKNVMNFKRILLILILILALIAGLIYIFFMSDFSFAEDALAKVNNLPSSSTTSSPSLAANDAKYGVIKLDDNSNYIGIGQEHVDGMTGYFTTFSTVAKEIPASSQVANSNSSKGKIYKEYKQNSGPWSNNPYWEGTMETDGCGITALSIVLSGYGKNFTPEMLRVRYSPALNMDNFSHELSNTFGIKNSGFLYDSVHLSNNYISKHLQTGRPVIVCVWSQAGDNRWTTASHYLVLLASDGQDKVYVSNPNGLENNSKSSGWYDINEVTKYLAKALFVESY